MTKELKQAAQQALEALGYGVAWKEGGHQKARAAIDALGAALTTSKPAQATPEPGWDSPLSDFQEGQWWVRELDAMAQKPDATADQKRAVAVVRHMLRAASKATPEPVGEPFAWTSMGQIRFTPPTQDHDTYTPLYTHPAPGVPDGEPKLTQEELLEVAKHAWLMARTADSLQFYRTLLSAAAQAKGDAHD